jgi:hypothetical protein
VLANLTLKRVPTCGGFGPGLIDVVAQGVQPIGSDPSGCSWSPAFLRWSLELVGEPHDFVLL